MLWLFGRGMNRPGLATQTVSRGVLRPPDAALADPADPGAAKGGAL